MPRSLIALGANLGDREPTLRRAIARLEAHRQIAIVACSRWHETSAVGGPVGQGPFLNGAVCIDTDLTGPELHAALQQIETDLGRTRSQHWAARAIDLDLLLHGDELIDTLALTVPHPRMAFRRFVLEPAVEVAPDMLHPRIGWSVRALLNHLDAARPYVALLGLPGSGKTALAASLSCALGGRPIADEVPPGPAPDPAESPSHVYARQIQFLRRRESALEAGSWPDRRLLAVSDFYFDQCLAYARMALDDNDYATFYQAWVAARKEVVPPKLLVVLGTPAGMPARQIEHEHQPRVGVPGTDRLQDELSRLAARGGLGPVLYAGGGDPQARFDEISAAIAAMQ
jgi:2-amino-4-hydroxy-6-hydroxymethyldihydropteridine diphosphokinase